MGLSYQDPSRLWGALRTATNEGFLGGRGRSFTRFRLIHFIAVPSSNHHTNRHDSHFNIDRPPPTDVPNDPMSDFSQPPDSLLAITPTPLPGLAIYTLNCDLTHSVNGGATNLQFG
jgi:hypothetical protein